MTRRLMSLCFRALMAWIILIPPAKAHEVRPAYLEIREQSTGHYAILWKQPALGDMALRLVPHMSNGWIDRPANVVAIDPRHLTKHWTVDIPHPGKKDILGGVAINVEGLDNSITDVLVRVSRADGATFETILRPDAPTAKIAFAATGGLPVPAYFRLGVEHILTGFDHLSFVFGLLLLIGLRWRLLKAITAFTIAHSLTLAASAFGLVQAPAATIEALVALSILFLAVELVRKHRGEDGVTQRHPWVVAFVFGLLHGFAFAGALRETGLPRDAIPQALLLFNLGVEAGQILFVSAAAAVIFVLRGVARHLPPAASQWGAIAPRYALGTFAAFWLIERTTLIFA